jgi:hypothetical protein
MSSFEVLHPHFLSPILFASCELQIQKLANTLVHRLCWSSNTKIYWAKWPGVHFPYTHQRLVLTTSCYTQRSTNAPSVRTRQFWQLAVTLRDQSVHHQCTPDSLVHHQCTLDSLVHHQIVRCAISDSQFCKLSRSFVWSAIGQSDAPPDSLVLLEKLQTVLTRVFQKWFWLQFFVWAREWHLALILSVCMHQHYTRHALVKLLIHNPSL